MKLRIVDITIFVIGVALLTGSVVRSGKATVTKPKSFVVQYLAYHPDKNGSLAVDEFRVRAVGQTGEWKETRYSTYGKAQTWGPIAAACLPLARVLDSSTVSFNLK